ncbi:MAG: ABC transporter ATP-binding protein [Alphaproteobacteria bacterium]|nr:MAG: ABC transporter ATP-binding protein [Alphaproteobacteria bacterium]
MFNLKHIRHTYIPNHDVLSKDIRIERGEHLLLLGPSGCGKTTLLNIMATLLPLESGEITFDNKDYSSLSQAQKDTMRAENFGFIFQRHHLIGHLNVVQNIAVTQTRKDPAYIKALIRTIGLEGKEKQKARDLSVGEAQRVAIARALANRPNVIFADEPTSALDDSNTQNIIDLIFDQAKATNATIIAATHDARIKSRFNNILEMSA